MTIKRENKQRAESAGKKIWLVEKKFLTANIFIER